MKLICWDTSSRAGAIAAIEWDPRQAQTSGERFRLVSEWTLNVDAAQHAERLLWAVHQMLEVSNWKLADIDVFGVGVGPGSFTGLRIGLTTARTLATTMGKPLVGVSSLAALARPAALHFAAHRKKTLVIASTDAAKGELFALYGAAKSVIDCSARSDQDFPGLWKRGVEEEVIAPEELMKRVKKKLGDDSQWIAVGEGRHRYPDAWKLLPKSKNADYPFDQRDAIQGRHLATLAWEGYQAGLARNALQVHPRYLRASDAEVKLKAGLLPPGPTRGEPDKK